MAMAGIKKAILKHLTEDLYCRLGVSKIHGVGVFAIRPIQKGVQPFKSLVRSRELKFSRKELESLPKGVRKQLEIFCYYEEDTIYIPSIGFNCVDMAIYVNHSKKPNLSFKKNGSLYAVRNIKKGEELMIDYDVSFGEKHKF